MLLEGVRTCVNVHTRGRVLKVYVLEGAVWQ